MLGFDEPAVIDREGIGERARKLARQRFPEVDPDAMCLYLAWAVMAVAHMEGIRLCLQAGAASWQRCHAEEGDNAFGYDDEDWDARHALESDWMPEMHVWAGDPVRQEIIDASAGCFPAQCMKMRKLGWDPSLVPPKTLWVGRLEMPETAFYRPSMKATMVAGVFLTRIRNSGRLAPPWRV